MEVILNEFKNYLKVKKSSNNTIESYERDIIAFEKYYSSKDVKLVDVDKDMLLEYIEELKKLKKSNATLCRVVASIKAYYKFLITKKLVETNIASEVNIKPEAKKKINILTKAEISDLLEKVVETDLKTSRDKLMFNLLYNTGMRVTELISLRVCDIDLKMMKVKINGSKGKRVIEIPNSLVKSLSNYIRNIRPLFIKKSQENTLFLNINGTQLSRQGFWKILKEHQKKANINTELSPHTLRHTFAVHSLKQGKDVHELKEILGHSDVAITMMYTNYIDEL